MNRFASKKFSVVMAAIVTSFVLSLAGKLTGEYATIMAVCVAAYQWMQGRIDEMHAKNGHGTV